MQQPNQYGERDYVFANAVVTKRLALGLTQQGLAALLGISTRAVENWEQGLTTPKAEHLRHFIALCIEHQAFSAGQELQEARALWQAARCKVLFDEHWLRALLGDARHEVVPRVTSVPPASLSPKEIAKGSGQSEAALEKQKGHASTSPGEPNRQRMLNRVHSLWIKGLLEDSLHGAALITLGLYEQPDALANPWRFSVQELDKPNRQLPAGTRITQVYDNADGELLILGEPGSGKTTLLLELARDLLNRAEHDIAHPIPVVFNLSSWAQLRLPLTTWLVEELHSKYQVPRDIGRMWIDTEQIIPLLDGLDEVASFSREECINALQTYQEVHYHVPLVLCSRRVEYQVLRIRVALRCAVMIQPLTSQQINDYLLSAGDQLGGIGSALENDAELREMVQTPLMLSILMLSYQGESLKDLLAEHSSEARKQHVFATYVERMFERRARSKRYSPQQTRHWLSFLAQQLAIQNQTLFYLERLQPNWLPEQGLRRGYRVIASLSLGLIAGLLLGLATGLRVGWDTGFVSGLEAGSISLLIFGLAFGLVFGRARYIECVEITVWSWARIRQNGVYALLAGLVYGSLGVRDGKLGGLLVCGLVLGMLNQLISRREKPAEGLSRLRNRFWQWALYGSLGGLAIGLSNKPTSLLGCILVGSLIFGLLNGLICGREKDHQKHSWIWQQLWRHVFSGLAFGVICGIVFHLVGRMLGELDSLLIVGLCGGLSVILVVKCARSGEAEEASSWLWVNMRRSAHYGLAYGLSCGVGYAILVSGLAFGKGFEVFNGLALGLVGGMAALTIRGVSHKIPAEHEHTTPNEGIKLSVQNALLAMGGSLVGVGLLDELVYGHGSGVVVGLAVGLLMGFSYGGVAWIHHSILRLFLWRAGYIPRNYADFLDYAAERILMRKIGGGYIFIHRLLLDYFIALKNPT